MAVTYAAFDDQAIWGTGDTPAAALADARGWLDPTRPDEVEPMIKAMSTAPMSAALATRVEKSGGNVAVIVRDGMLITDEEE